MAGYEMWPLVFTLGEGERYIITNPLKHREAFLVDLYEQSCTCPQSGVCDHILATRVASAYFSTIRKALRMTEEEFTLFYEKWWPQRRAKLASFTEQGEKYWQMEAFYSALAEVWRQRRSTMSQSVAAVNEVMGGTLGYLFEKQEGE